MGLFDYLFGARENQVSTRFYEVSNGDGILHYYMLRNLFSGKNLVDRYWHPVDSEGKFLIGTNSDKKIQCISVQKYQELIQNSRNPKMFLSVQTDLEQLAQKTTPGSNEGVLVRITREGNNWQMKKLGCAKPLV